MNNLIKLLLFVSPILGLVLFYVISQQHQHSAEMHKADVQFERNWNEFDRDFTKDPAQKKVYEDRAVAANKELLTAKKEEEEAKAKSKKFQEQFEESLNDPETQKALKKKQEEQR